MALFKSFEELDCWEEAASLRKELSVLAKTFPQEEKYLLADQIKRASRSVTNNIAEGFGRFHYQEFIKYCRDSRDSLYELLDHVIIAYDEKYISMEQLIAFRKRIEKCSAILNGLINCLLRQKEKNNLRINEPELEYAILPESTGQPINESTYL